MSSLYTWINGENFVSWNGWSKNDRRWKMLFLCCKNCLFSPSIRNYTLLEMRNSNLTSITFFSFKIHILSWQTSFLRKNNETIKSGVVLLWIGRTRIVASSSWSETTITSCPWNCTKKYRRVKSVIEAITLRN